MNTRADTEQNRSQASFNRLNEFGFSARKTRSPKSTRVCETSGFAYRTDSAFTRSKPFCVATTSDISLQCIVADRYTLEVA